MQDQGGIGKPFPSADELGDPEFFKRLNPELTISDHPHRADDPELRFSAADADRLTRQLRQEGYFQSAPIVPTAFVERLARGVARLADARVLPLFIGMYDEFWRVLHMMRQTLSPIAGGAMRLAPDYWAWHIAPSAKNRGWRFHRDAGLQGPSFLDPNGLPRLLTVWIPFTDATTHNSCIYVVPFPHDPAVQAYLRNERVAADAMPTGEQLLGARALPVSAGSILGWTPYIAHWGSESTDWATHARISVGIYYERTDWPETAGCAFDDEGRRYIDVNDSGFRLTPEHRRAIIANNIATYLPGPHVRNEPQYSSAVFDFCMRWNRKGLVPRA